jgi:hypothetical protein
MVALPLGKNPCKATGKVHPITGHQGHRGGAEV